MTTTSVNNFHDVHQISQLQDNHPDNNFYVNPPGIKCLVLSSISDYIDVCYSESHAFMSLSPSCRISIGWSRKRRKFRTRKGKRDIKSVCISCNFKWGNNLGAANELFELTAVCTTSCVLLLMPRAIFARHTIRRIIIHFC